LALVEESAHTEPGKTTRKSTGSKRGINFVKPEIERWRDLNKTLLPFNGAQRFGGYKDNTIDTLNAVDNPVEKQKPYLVVPQVIWRQRAVSYAKWYQINMLDALLSHGSISFSTRLPWSCQSKGPVLDYLRTISPCVRIDVASIEKSKPGKTWGRC
jgi:hypothetical protein